MKKNPKPYESAEYANIREMIEDCAERFPTRVAFSYRVRPQDPSPVRVSFPALRDDIRALGSELLARGVKGKKVALIGKLTYPWVCSFLSLLSIGAVVVPLDREWQAEELAKTAAHADCEFLFCDPNLSGQAEAVMRAVPSG